ncbi:MAG TPA: hypothetical protein VGJ59_22145 [Jatrophihabitantaceae bacterium]|jgi:hypothetical protein
MTAGGLAIRTRLLCDCRGVISIYQRGDGTHYFPHTVSSDETTVSIRCPSCGRVGTVDTTKLRHAIAERRRTFRIE